MRAPTYYRLGYRGGRSYGGFQWPLTAGGRAEAPDWDANLDIRCGSGLHIVRLGGYLHDLLRATHLLRVVPEDVVPSRDGDKYRCRAAVVEAIWPIGSARARAIFLKDAGWAFYYARAADGEPRDDTRRAACREPEYAYRYPAK